VGLLLGGRFCAVASTRAMIASNAMPVTSFLRTISKTS